MDKEELAKERMRWLTQDTDLVRVLTLLADAVAELRAEVADLKSELAAHARS